MSSPLNNVHNYFYAVYESRYVSGVVAGMKLAQMIEDGTITADAAKIGYVGAFPFAEVISGFTSFFLGARSQCPSVTMEVRYTNSWADMAAGKGNRRGSDRRRLRAHFPAADTTGAPSACEAAGVPCVGYNISMLPVAPNTALTSAAGDWGAYVTYAVKCLIDGEEIDRDWCKGYAEGAVYTTELNDSIVAPGTAEKVAGAGSRFQGRHRQGVRHLRLHRERRNPDLLHHRLWSGRNRNGVRRRVPRKLRPQRSLFRHSH